MLTSSRSAGTAATCSSRGADAFLAQKRARDRLRPLLDRDGLHDRLPGTLPSARPDPKRVAFVVEEFIRVLGLLPGGLGRSELVLLTTGAGLLRDLLRDLMLETCPLLDRGGMLHLSRLLTPEQMAELEALPYPDREEVVAAHLAIAQAFLPLARRSAPISIVQRARRQCRKLPLS